MTYLKKDHQEMSYIVQLQSDKLSLIHVLMEDTAVTRESDAFI